MRYFLVLIASFLMTAVIAQNGALSNIEVGVFGSSVMQKRIYYSKYSSVSISRHPVYDDDSLDQQIDPILSNNYVVFGFNAQKYFPIRKNWSWGVGLGYKHRKLEYQQLFIDVSLSDDLSFVGLQYSAKYNTWTASTSLRYHLMRTNTMFEIGGDAGTSFGKVNKGQSELVFNYNNNVVETRGNVPKKKLLTMNPTFYFGVQQKLWKNLYLTSRISHVTRFGDKYFTLFSHRKNGELIYEGRAEDGRTVWDFGFSWHFGSSFAKKEK